MHIKLVVDEKAGLEEVSLMTKELEVLGHSINVFPPSPPMVSDTHAVHINNDSHIHGPLPCQEDGEVPSQ